MPLISYNASDGINKKQKSKNKQQKQAQPP
jgi:hypothetical protein